MWPPRDLSKSQLFLKRIKASENRIFNKLKIQFRILIYRSIIDRLDIGGILNFLEKTAQKYEEVMFQI